MDSPAPKNSEEELKQVINSLTRENYGLKSRLSNLEKYCRENIPSDTEHRFKTIINNIINIPVQGYNSNREVIFWNRASEKLYGYNENEAFGKKLEDLIVPEFMKEEVIKNVNNWINGDIQIPPEELTLKNKDGDNIPVFSNHAMITNSIGEKEMYCIDIDLTKLKAREKELIQSQKMESVGKLAGGIAHDFNNLLTVINGYCELIKDTELNNEQKDWIENIHSSGVKAERLTGQLLAFSRKQVARPENIQIKEVIENHINLIKRILGEDIKIETDFKTGSYCVYMDPVQFEQILMNLCVNARDAMPDGGILKISAEKKQIADQKIEGAEIIPGEYLSITISDTGTGMDESVKNKAFEPFFTTKEVNKGTGLGLSTVYGIVKQNKGYIFIQSKKNRGTSFQIYLPFNLKNTGLNKKQTNEKLKHKGNETILYVEDDPSVKKITESILKSHGYNVLSTGSPTEAIEIFSTEKIDADLLITDVIMPGINGKELAQSLKKKDPYLKILYTSGYTGETISAKGLISKSFNFIQKPYTVKEITKKIRMILDS